MAIWLLSAPVKAENVILFIGDGIGFGQIKAARFYNGGPLSFEELPYQAQITTYSANSSVTDSAAAATALATGVKVNNYVVSLAIPGDGSELETTLEFYKQRGRKTGLITTTPLTHATPACFGAHETDRNNSTQIANDYLRRSIPNILFGGGGNGLTPSAAAAAGYVVATDKATFDSLNVAADHLSAQFGTSFLPYEYDYLLGNYPYPHLADMVAKALAAFESHPDGFFLMVEGGMIDQACHDHHLRRSVHETLEFSQAVQVALDWAATRTDTLILVTSDHETGGLAVTKDNGQGAYPNVTWSTTGHTGANVPAYAWGLRAHHLAGIQDNTDVHRICTGEAIPVFTTLVAPGSTWKYDASGTDLGFAWREVGFDDSQWSSGPAKLGYGDGDEATVIPKTNPVYPCYYFRQAFNVDNPTTYTDLILRVLRDDGAVVYLNGFEVARYGLPGGNITYNTWASTSTDYPWDAAVVVPNLLVSGLNVLSVEIHQGGSTSSDLGFDLELKAQQLAGVPSAPVLSAVAGDQRVTLTWTASQDPEGEAVVYSLYRRLAAENYDEPLATGLTDTNYTDTAVVNNTAYDYRVRALDPGLLFTDSAEVEVTPAVPNPPQNQPPVAQDDVISASADTAININVLGNDSDPDNDRLSVSIVAQPDHGTAILNEPGQTIRYEPAIGFAGADDFTYEVNDSRGGIATARVAIEVVAAPVLVTITESPEASGDFTVVWQVYPGRTYQLQFKNDLGDATWIDLGDEVTAGSPILEFSHSTGTSRHGFYRLLEMIVP